MNLGPAEYRLPSLKRLFAPSRSRALHSSRSLRGAAGDAVADADPGPISVGQVCRVRPL